MKLLANENFPGDAGETLRHLATRCWLRDSTDLYHFARFEGGQGR